MLPSRIPATCPCETSSKIGISKYLVPIDRDGIQINKLPANIPTVYVSLNQFPTGSIMPVGRRYALLDWAYRNRSIIIEDDYNSELRYDSRPFLPFKASTRVNKSSISSFLLPSFHPSKSATWFFKPLFKLFREDGATPRPVPKRSSLPWLFT